MMSKKSMLASTIIITMITLLFVYIDYAYAEYNRFQTYTLLAMCITNVFLVVSVVILLFGNTKTETWVNNKWDRLGFENQEEIRTWVQIIVIISFILCIAICFQSTIWWRSWIMITMNKITVLLSFYIIGASLAVFMASKSFLWVIVLNVCFLLIWVIATYGFKLFQGNRHEVEK